MPAGAGITNHDGNIRYQERRASEGRADFA